MTSFMKDTATITVLPERRTLLKLEGALGVKG